MAVNDSDERVEARGDSARGLLAEEAGAPGQPRRPRVLLVEDDPNVRFLVRSVFDEDGRFDVVGEAEDGVEALSLASTLEPDAVVLDLMMPRMDGAGAIRKLREEEMTPVIVVLTCLRSPQVEPETWLGADAYVHKYDFASVPSVVASLCLEPRITTEGFAD